MGDPPPAGADVPKLAHGVRITKVVLNQGVRHTLMASSAVNSSIVPVIADRPGVMRVFYETDGNYDGQSVNALLTVGDRELSTDLVLGGTSSDSDMSSTVNFSVPSDWVAPNMSYRVELTQVRPAIAPSNSEAAFPALTQKTIAVKPALGGLKVVLVPVVYNGDGSGRLPDTSTAQVNSYADHIFSQFPVSDVSISVRAPFNWDQTVEKMGDGWGTLLNAIADLRAADGVSNDTYYYGIFAPADTFQTYCSGGCVTGLGFLSPAFNSWSRASIGLGFTGDMFSETAVHELGHNHGREHTPCGGPANPDPNFPHTNGQLGAWGYDLVSKELKEPSTHADFMSYCDPAWVSDYTFSALYDRMSLVSSAAVVTPAEWRDRTYDRVAVGSDGKLSWLAPATLPTPPMGESTELAVNRGGRTGTTEGQMLRYDHIDGGVMFVPRPRGFKARDKAHAVQFKFKGRTRRLAR
jgi:hypothetical protein